MIEHRIDWDIDTQKIRPKEKVKITTTKNKSFKIETHDAIIFATLEEAKQLVDKLPMHIEQLERGEQANGD